jgi:hypothetical protein
VRPPPSRLFWRYVATVEKGPLFAGFFASAQVDRGLRSRKCAISALGLWSQNSRSWRRLRAGRAISAATFGSVRKCVAPMRGFVLPNGCSTAPAAAAWPGGCCRGFGCPIERTVVAQGMVTRVKEHRHASCRHVAYSKRIRGCRWRPLHTDQWQR